MIKMLYFMFKQNFQYNSMFAQIFNQSLFAGCIKATVRLFMQTQNYELTHESRAKSLSK